MSNKLIKLGFEIIGTDSLRPISEINQEDFDMDNLTDADILGLEIYNVVHGVLLGLLNASIDENEDLYPDALRKIIDIVEDLGLMRTNMELALGLSRLKQMLDAEYTGEILLDIDNDDLDMKVPDLNIEDDIKVDNHRFENYVKDEDELDENDLKNNPRIYLDGGTEIN